MTGLLPGTGVLIVGGGLAGLSAAVFLSRQGVECTLVEQQQGPCTRPRARGVHPRAMELLRSTGLEEEVRATPSARALAGNSGVVAAESLAGPEFGTLDETYVSDVESDLTGLSPASWCLVHQGELEGVLRSRAERLGAAVHFHTRLDSLTQSEPGGPDAEGGVTATVSDVATGVRRRIRSRYLVAADGAHSTVRDRLGLAFDGEVLGRYLNVHFRADLHRQLRGRRFLMCYTVNDRLHGALMPLDNAADWQLHAVHEGRPADPVQLVRAAAGVPGLEPEIVSAEPWESAARTAPRFRSRRVFLVGDAAHVMPPSGGFGSSTGMQDAHNLAWKLAAVLGGRASPRLLESYDAERRPVGTATVEQAVLRSRDRLRLAGREAAPVHPDIVPDTRVWLGWRYRSSAVDCGADDGQGVWATGNDGSPGARAPHLRLRRADGSALSTLDLFGDRWVLLTGPDGRAWRTAGGHVTAALGVPLNVHGIGCELADADGCWAVRYGVTSRGAVLVRPDGVVAWRRATAPRPPDTPTRALCTALERLLTIKEE